MAADPRTPHPSLAGTPWGDPDFDPTCSDCQSRRHGRFMGMDVAPPDSLAAAWAAAEAALPEGWVVSGVWLSGHGVGRYEASAQGPKRSQQVTGDTNKPTPAAAMLSLADKLREVIRG